MLSENFKKGSEQVLLQCEYERKAREAQREYNRQWRARNKDKVKEYNKRYWERRAQREQHGEGEDVKKEIQS